MRPLSYLSNTATLLVADTSVAIALNATGCAADIFRALPHRFVIVDLVQAELEAGRERGHTAAGVIRSLIDSKHISVVSLGDVGLAYFEQLVVGPAAQTLDDGEAATLAYALEFNATAVIDERKALKICASRFGNLATATSFDLLGHSEVGRVLGTVRLAEAVFLALRDARVRVPDHHVAWVIGLIGPERALECRSLPRSARFKFER